MNVTNSIFKQLKEESFNLSSSVKMAKSVYTKKMIKDCVTKEDEKLSGTEKLNIEKTANEIYSVFQLSADNLINICRYYSMQLDGVFCKRIVLQKEYFDNPEKKISNIEKYPDKDLLKGIKLKKKGFSGKDLFADYPVEYKDKALKTFVRTDKDLTTYAFIKSDRFNLYFVLDAIRDYIKAGKPDIETLKTK